MGSDTTFLGADSLEADSMSDIKKSLEAAEKFAKQTEAMVTAQKLLSELVKPISLPKFDFPSLDRYELPKIDIPTPEERNEYQSASRFMKAISDAAVEWKANLPDGYAPAIVAILYGGIEIHVQSLAQVSFHGIRVQGLLNGNPCTMLAHQSTVQILCVAQEVSKEKPRNPIGFIWPNNSVKV